MPRGGGQGVGSYGRRLAKIREADILDDAVGLPALKAGTRGALIQYAGAGGDPAEIGPGDSAENRGLVFKGVGLDAVLRALAGELSDGAFDNAFKNITTAGLVLVSKTIDFSGRAGNSSILGIAAIRIDNPQTSTGSVLELRIGGTQFVQETTSALFAVEAMIYLIGRKDDVSAASHLFELFGDTATGQYQVRGSMFAILDLGENP